MVQKCVMVDIDEAVCNFCRDNLEINRPAFQSVSLLIVIHHALVHCTVCVFSNAGKRKNEQSIDAA